MELTRQQLLLGSTVRILQKQKLRPICPRRNPINMLISLIDVIQIRVYIPLLVTSARPRQRSPVAVGS